MYVNYDIFLRTEIENSFMSAVPDWANKLFEDVPSHTVFSKLQVLLREYKKASQGGHTAESSESVKEIYFLFLNILLIFHESGHAVFTVKNFPRSRYEIDHISLDEAGQEHGGGAAVYHKAIEVSDFCETFDERRIFMGSFLAGYLHEPFIQLSSNGKVIQVGSKWEDQKPDQRYYNDYKDLFLKEIREDWSEGSPNFLMARELARMEGSELVVKSLAMYILEKWFVGVRRINGHEVYTIVQP